MYKDKVSMSVHHEFDVIECKVCLKRFVILGVLDYTEEITGIKCPCIPFTSGLKKTDFCPMCGSKQESI